MPGPTIWSAPGTGSAACGAMKTIWVSMARSSLLRVIGIFLEMSLDQTMAGAFSMPAKPKTRRSRSISSAGPEIGREECRERVWQYVKYEVVDDSLQNKQKRTERAREYKH